MLTQGKRRPEEYVASAMDTETEEEDCFVRDLVADRLWSLLRSIHLFRNQSPLCHSTKVKSAKLWN